MAAGATCDKIWQELRKLKNDVPPPQDSSGQGSSYYKDYAAFQACNEIRSRVGRCSELPRDQFLDVFTRLVAGPRLEELFDLFKDSRSSDHPALQYACLLALHGVAELSDRRKDMLSRPEVVGELCAVMASPRRRVVTPKSAGAAGSEVVNAAAGAVTTITGLFTSNGTLEPFYAKIWVDLGAVSALAACLESHAAFDRANPVSTDLPLCFFLIATSLLAGAAGAVSEEDKIRLGTAWLTLFVEATRWIAHEAADLLADFFNRPNWLMGVVTKIPEELRARAVEAARLCERAGARGEAGGAASSWKRGKAERLAVALLCGCPAVWDEERKLAGWGCAGPGCDHVQKCGDGAAVSRVGASAGAGAAKEAGGAPFKRCSQCRANMVLMLSATIMATAFIDGAATAAVHEMLGRIKTRSLAALPTATTYGGMFQGNPISTVTTLPQPAGSMSSEDDGASPTTSCTTSTGRMKCRHPYTVSRGRRRRTSSRSPSPVRSDGAVTSHSRPARDKSSVSPASPGGVGCDVAGSKAITIERKAVSTGTSTATAGMRIATTSSEKSPIIAHGDRGGSNVPRGGHGGAKARDEDVLDDALPLDNPDLVAIVKGLKDSWASILSPYLSRVSVEEHLQIEAGRVASANVASQRPGGTLSYMPTPYRSRRLLRKYKDAVSRGHRRWPLSRSPSPARSGEACSSFKVGDKVIRSNEYGVAEPGMIVSVNENDSGCTYGFRADGWMQTEPHVCVDDEDEEDEREEEEEEEAEEEDAPAARCPAATGLNGELLESAGADTELLVAATDGRFDLKVKQEGLLRETEIEQMEEKKSEGEEKIEEDGDNCKMDEDGWEQDDATLAMLAQMRPPLRFLAVRPEDGRQSAEERERGRDPERSSTPTAVLHETIPRPPGGMVE
eukprot:g8131.t1